MERHARTPSTGREATKSTTVVDPRTSLAIWLRTGRAEKGLSLDDVARITKIQLKTLERLEAGTADGLPADVFVRGFVRSYARCVGLDEDEALKRYQQCNDPTPVVVEEIPVAARAVVEAMAELAPTVAEQISSPEPEPEPEPKPNKKRRRGAKRAKRRSARMATGTPVEPTPVVEAEPGRDPAPVVEAAPEVIPEPQPEPQPEPIVEPEPVVEDEPIATETWQPTMPPLKTTPTTNVPWRLGRPASKPARPLVPSLVIDDAEPEIAERVLEERAAACADDGRDAPRRSFLPPILLDRDDRSIRQGGLTLAVILLLIAATLTLSYLMRRPSSSGDGVTQADSPASLIG